MIFGKTVKNLTAKLLHAGFLRADLVPMVLAYPCGHQTFEYVIAGKTVGMVGNCYTGESVVDEVAESVRLFRCPTAHQLYENWKMEPWLVARLGATQ